MKKYNSLEICLKSESLKAVNEAWTMALKRPTTIIDD